MLRSIFCEVVYRVCVTPPSFTTSRTQQNWTMETNPHQLPAQTIRQYRTVSPNPEIFDSDSSLNFKQSLIHIYEDEDEPQRSYFLLCTSWEMFFQTLQLLHLKKQVQEPVLKMNKFDMSYIPKSKAIQTQQQKAVYSYLLAENQMILKDKLQGLPD